MRRRAIVAGIREDWVDLLSLDETETAHEKSYDTANTCGSTGCTCRVSGRTFRAAIPRNLPIHNGDTVEVTASPYRALIAFSAIIALPVAAGAAAWFLVGLWHPAGMETLKAAATALAVLGTSAISLVFGKKKASVKSLKITAVS